jgi:hypothetical protein
MRQVDLASGGYSFDSAVAWDVIELARWCGKILKARR